MRYFGVKIFDRIPHANALRVRGLGMDGRGGGVVLPAAGCPTPGAGLPWERYRPHIHRSRPGQPLVVIISVLHRKTLPNGDNR